MWQPMCMCKGPSTKSPHHFIKQSVLLVAEQLCRRASITSSFHSQLTELEVFVQFHSENTTLLEASTADNMVNTKLCCSSYTLGTVCGTQTVWGGVTNMFSAHGSCDGLFVMNELHHMVMTYFNGKMREKKMTRIELDHRPHTDSMCGTIVQWRQWQWSVWVRDHDGSLSLLVVCVWDGGSVAVSPCSAGARITWPMWV